MLNQIQQLDKLMSGIFGVFDARERSVLPTADAMVQQLCQFPTQYTERYCSSTQCEVLGRVGIGIYNVTPQPVWNETQTAAVVLAGRLIREPGFSGQASVHPDPNFILDLYQQHGDAFCAHLRGSFAVALYDRTRRQVIVASDRMGTYHIYYARRQGRFLFAPNQHLLLHDRTIPADLDFTALAQYMRFQQLLHDTSFFEHVKLLRGGRQLIYDIKHDELTESTYWRFDPDLPVRDDLSFEDAADETTGLIVQAVGRCCEGTDRAGVFLSGGLDSRIIVAALERVGRRPAALTYGSPESRDAYYAKRVAEQAGLSHHICARSDGHWVRQYWRQHLMLTDASHSWIHMHGIYALEDARAHMDVNLSGFAGDGALSGSNLRDIYVAANDEASYAAAMFYGLTMLENWPGMSETDEQLLFTKETFELVKGKAFGSLRHALAPYSTYVQPLRTELFLEYAVDIRHYAHYLSFKRSAIEVGLPFVDPDLLDFVCRLPATYRKGQRLSRAVLQRLSPSLSLIPYDYDEMLPTNNTALRTTHHFVSRLKRRTQKALGLARPHRSTLHSDYETWLRTDLRDWGESILFDRRVEDRGLFNPEFIRSIWNRHQSGKEVATIGKIAPIMSYELMLREFVDCPPMGGEHENHAFASRSS